MDLTTLVTVCALTIDPKVMHALIWHQSGGEPWSFSVSGRRQPRVLRSVGKAIDAARATRPDDAAIRVGLTGLPATPETVTASMFSPCANITSAARQIAQFTELCRISAPSKEDPVHCAVAAWRGSWERPDTRFADAVRTSVAQHDAPDFEMPGEAGVQTAGGGSLASKSAVGATPPPAVPDDRQRARESPLFPVLSRPSDHPPGGVLAGDQPASGEQKTDAPTVRRTATRPRADGLFVPRSEQRLAPESE